MSRVPSLRNTAEVHTWSTSHVGYLPTTLVDIWLCNLWITGYIHYIYNINNQKESSGSSHQIPHYVYDIWNIGKWSSVSLEEDWSAGTSLVAQWLRIHLPMQGTQVWSLVQEDPTCRGATKPMHHNYWACTLEPRSHNYWAHVPQLLKPARLEPVLCNKRSHHNEKPTHHNEKPTHRNVE